MVHDKNKGVRGGGSVCLRTARQQRSAASIGLRTFEGSSANAGCAVCESGLLSWARWQRAPYMGPLSGMATWQPLKASRTEAMNRRPFVSPLFVGSYT